MKNSIILALIFAGLLYSSCNNAQNKTTKMKDVNEIAKLSEEQYEQEVAEVFINAHKGMIDLLNDSKKIDADFEKKLDNIFDNAAKQMIQYGKALDLKDSETREAYSQGALIKSYEELDKLDKKYNADAELLLEKREPEFAAYASQSLKQIFNGMYALHTFLDVERVKTEMPEMAKRFGVK